MSEPARLTELMHRAQEGDAEAADALFAATFAYLLLKPKWDANQQKNWERIEGWDDDQSRDR